MAENAPHIVVIGSSFIDFAIRCNQIPEPGQVVCGNGFSYKCVGPAVNQSVQAVRCGCNVDIVTKIGSDDFGELLRSNLEFHKIKTDNIIVAEAKSTGAIVTMVNAVGENASCISAGSNRAMTSLDIENAESVIADANACLIHGDLPQEAVIAALRTANMHRVKILFDPAIGKNNEGKKHVQMPMDYFLVSVLIVNAEEAAEFADEAVIDLHKAKLVGSDLVTRGAQNVVIKMGRRGCLIVNREGTEHIKPFEVEMVDKTCAGDAFVGALAASFAVGDSLKQAVRFAAAAGALACTKFGSLESLPQKTEILELLQNLNFG